ncbi:MAG: CoB--CoM heterodisulfide reductase iron-sulfur subunit A family protein, partial [bacterium]|nr:CoB--CoM heterodisulfide reductase iron-sulfur subunit A family protein [bacterium]
MANSNNGGGKIRTDLLVIGGGIAGMTAAIEAAEAGAGAVIVEKNSYLGGRVSQLYQYFPKLCPPSCGLEINFRRIKDQKDNVKVFVDSEVTKIEGESGNYTVTIKQSPRFINENCTACGDCEKACTTEIDNDFNFGMDKHKAVYLPHEMAFPAKYVLKKDACSDDELKAIKDSCQYNAVDLDMTEKEITVECSTITVSTGWKPYEVEKVENLGFGTNKNIITNMMMERLASLNGPTEGKILKPSDGGEVSSVAFVQCAGSRDENHLKYCSAVCCLASMKQATYVRDQYPEAEIHMFYIDVRSPGRLEDFYTKRQEDEKLFFHRGKV